MKRSPFVLAGTVVGLASILSFHTSHVKISLTAISGPTTSVPPVTTTTQPPTSTTTVASNGPTTTTSTTTGGPTTSTTGVPTGKRTVTGPMVNYYYGQLSVKVTASAQKITKVAIASISDGGNPLSIQIDHYAIPMLEPEVLAAQSYNIQSISGASYTSAGFAMSLQYALKKLGI